MARTLSSVPSIERGTLTMTSSHNGNSDRMDCVKGYPSMLPLRMKVNPLIFTRGIGRINAFLKIIHVVSQVKVVAYLADEKGWRGGRLKNPCLV